MNEPNKVTVEGLKLMACYQCSEIGQIGWKVRLEKMRDGRLDAPKRFLKKIKPPSNSKSKLTTNKLENYEVIENFSENIKKGRERIGISQEEFAKLIKEKLSVIQKIESGKIVPSIKLSREIEHTLKIELLLNQKEVENDLTSDATSDLTIGDVLHFKKKEKT